MLQLKAKRLLAKQQSFTVDGDITYFKGLCGYLDCRQPGTRKNQNVVRCERHLGHHDLKRIAA